MKTAKTILGVLVLALMLTTVSCKDEKKVNDTAVNHVNDGKMYACSMHPDIIGEKGEKCSKCGMKLTEEVKKAHNNSDGHHDGESKKMAMNGSGASQAILNDYEGLWRAVD